MTAGLRIRNASGTFVTVSNETTSLALQTPTVQTSVATVFRDGAPFTLERFDSGLGVPTGIWLHNIPRDRNELIFVRMKNGEHYRFSVGDYLSDGLPAGQLQVQASTQTIQWLKVRPASESLDGLSPHGLRLRNSAGRITFDLVRDTVVQLSASYDMPVFSSRTVPSGDNRWINLSPLATWYVNQASPFAVFTRLVGTIFPQQTALLHANISLGIGGLNYSITQDQSGAVMNVLVADINL